MSGLEQTFYIMGIIFMTLMFLLMIALVVAVFAIRAKIKEIERNIREQIADKIGMVTNLFNVGETVAGIVKKVVHRRQET
jgi:cell division protein FtsL